jgi:hypothetical protein
MATKKEGFVSVAAYNAAIQLKHYYKNKLAECVCRKPTGRPRKNPKPGEVSITELKTEKRRNAELREMLDKLESENALLANEVMRWRAAFIHKCVDLDHLTYPPLREAIDRTDCVVNGKRTCANPLVKARRPRATDSVSTVTQSLLPKVPKPSRDLRARPQVPGSDQGTDRPCDTED